MARVRVSIVIDAPPRRVWAAVRDIGSHVDWMQDAAAIRFTTHQREGVGTRFDCDTRIGPIGFTDRMEIVEWDAGRTIGIHHVGLVRGVGRFTIRRRIRGGTHFMWEERLVFPWWLAGPLGATAAVPVLRAVWRRNIRRLKALVEGVSA